MSRFVSSDDEYTFQWLRTMQKKSLKINKFKAVHWIGKANYYWRMGSWSGTYNFGAILIILQKDKYLLFLRTK